MLLRLNQPGRLFPRSPVVSPVAPGTAHDQISRRVLGIKVRVMRLQPDRPFAFGPTAPAWCAMQNATSSTAPARRLFRGSRTLFPIFAIAFAVPHSSFLPRSVSLAIVRIVCQIVRGVRLIVRFPVRFELKITERTNERCRTDELKDRRGVYSSSPRSSTYSFRSG